MSDRRPPDEPHDPPSPPDPLLDGLDDENLWVTSAEALARRAAEKRELLETSLGRGRTQVRIDALKPGVRVPDHLATCSQLALNLSWRFADTHMVVNDRGVAATLTFAGTPFRCVLPWSSLWGLVPHGADVVKVWPAELPPELGGPPRDPTAPEPPPVEPQRPRLEAVRSAALPQPAPPAEPASAEPAPAPAATESPKARPPWLRLVRPSD